MKKILFILVVGITTLTSCEPDSTTGTVLDTSVLLKKTIDTFDDGSIVTTEFTYVGNRLTEMSSDDGSSDTFVYSGGFLTESVHTWGGDSSTETYEYDSSDRLKKIYNDGVLAYTFTYNTDGTITKTADTGSVTVLTFFNGNLVKQTYDNSTAGVSSVTTYTYDVKNNPLRNIQYAEVLALLEYYNTNNLLVSATSGSAADDYDNNSTVYSSYNASDFPLAATTIAAPGTPDEETTTTELFYE